MSEDFNLFYRFRPLVVVKGKGEKEDEKTVLDEILNQEMYLASRKQLNDPVEAMPLFVWNGDQVVWDNLFDHYMLSMAETWLEVALINNDRLNLSEIITIVDHSHFNEDCKQFVQMVRDTELHQLPKALSNWGTLSTEEIVGVFTFLQFHVCKVLLAWHTNVIGSHNIIIPDAQIDPQLIDILLKQNQLDQLNDIFSEQKKNSYLAQFLGAGVDSRIKTQNFFTFLNEFPKVYFSKLGSSRGQTDYFIACFTIKNDNFLMWSHYAESHTGVCLVFKSQKNEKGKSCISSQSGQEIPLKEVDYSDEPPEINFFEHMHLNRQNIDYWLKRDGNESSLIDAYETKKNGSDFYQKHYLPFETRSLFKLNDWEKEDEYRIVSPDMLHYGQIHDQNQMIYYDFDDLEGIIFGAKTPEVRKAEIVKEIWKKCREQGRNHFSFSQASLALNDGKLTVTKILDKVYSREGR